MSSNIAALKQESPLYYFHGVSSHFASDSHELFNAEAEFSVVVKEIPLSTQLNLRGDASDTVFVTGVKEVLGIELPTVPSTYHCNEHTRICWLGPNEWLITSTDASINLPGALRQKLSGHISIVDISGGQTAINLRGSVEGIETVLKKSSIYDFTAWDVAKPGVGRCVQSTFAKASALISNRRDGSYDLLIRRSFADYIAQWLLDAGREFGCRIEGW